MPANPPLTVGGRLPGASRKKRRPPPLRAPRGARERAELSVQRLSGMYPAACELDFRNPFELTIATILSAQTTDRAVNAASPALFASYPTAHALAAADPAEVELIVKSTGFFRSKTRSIIACAQHLVARFDGEVPPRLEDLVTLPGIGRKTANVILGVAFHLPGFAVDTHVIRLSNRLGLAGTRDPEKIERIVTRMVPPEEWAGLSLRLILHGRRVCDSRRPRCEECLLNDYCPSSLLRGT